MLILATSESLTSEERTAGDAEWKAIAARGEAVGRQVLAKAAASAETSARMAAEFAARPGGEAVAEAHRRIAVRAGEFAVYMREVGELELSDSDSDSEEEV